MNDFSRTTLRALARKGIRVIGTQLVPDMSHEMPWTNPTVCYVVDDNGTGKVRTHGEVLALAAQ